MGPSSAYESDTSGAQVINFFTRQPIEDPGALVYPLNSTMPPDVQFYSIKVSWGPSLHSWQQM